MTNYNYSDGKIYCIKDNISKDIYVGHTIQPLNIRLRKHETDYRGFMGFNNKHRNYRSSADVIFNGDYNIHLLEQYPCQTKKDLAKRETLWILKMSEKFKTTNKVMPSKISKDELDYLNNLLIPQHILSHDI